MEKKSEQNKPLNADGIEAVRFRLKAFLEEHGITQSAAAKGIGRTASVASTFIAGKYEGDNTEIAALFSEWMDAEEAARNAPVFKFPFVHIAGSRVFFRFAQIAHYKRVIVALTGEAGVGKTESARQYAALHPGVIFFESYIGEKPQSFFSRLCELFELSGKGTPPQLLESLIAKLSGSGRLLIVDEAENLNPLCLDHLRRLWDMTGIGILLLGTQELRSNLRAMRGNKAQIRTRVKHSKVISKPSIEDYETILEAVNSEHVKYASIFHAESDGIVREFEQCYDTALDYCKSAGTELNEEIIKAAAAETVI